MSALEEYENNRMYHDASGDTGSMMDEADAAIEELKCCGNCEWFRAVEYQNCVRSRRTDRRAG